jgi:hypothetical protein
MLAFPETNFTTAAIVQVLEEEDESRVAQLIASMIGLPGKSEGSGGASDPRVALVEHYCACLGAGSAILGPAQPAKIAAMLNVCQGALAACSSLRWPLPAAGEAERVWAHLLAASSATSSADRAAAAHAAYKRGATYGSRAALSHAVVHSSRADGYGSSAGLVPTASGTHGDDPSAASLLFSASEAQAIDEWAPQFGTLYAYPLLRLAFLGKPVGTRIENVQEHCKLTIETPFAVTPLSLATMCII